jgi:hypothetical protein
MIKFIIKSIQIINYEYSLMFYRSFVEGTYEKLKFIIF